MLQIESEENSLHHELVYKLPTQVTWPVNVAVIDSLGSSLTLERVADVILCSSVKKKKKKNWQTYFLFNCASKPTTV